MHESKLTRTDMKRLKRFEIIKQVYLLVETHTESFELKDNVGPDLAYLLGSIAAEEGVQWAPSRPIWRIIKKHGPKELIEWLKENVIELNEEYFVDLPYFGE